MANLLDGISPVTVVNDSATKGQKVISLKTDKDGTYETCAVEKDKYDEFVNTKKKINKKSKIAKWITGVLLTAIGAGAGRLILKHKIGALIGAGVGLLLGALGIDIINSNKDKKIAKANKEFIETNS